MNWSLKMQISEKIETIINILEQYLKENLKNINEVLEELKSGVDDVDNLSMFKIWNYLLNKNIAIKIDAKFHKISNLPEEPWIGNRNAFQLSIYYWILKIICTINRVARLKNLRITLCKCV